MIHRIKKNDTVQILSGKDKGKKGLVLEVAVSSGKVLVQGVQIVTRHVKARKQGKTSEIKKSEAYIPLCKVMLICSACHVPSRINSKVTQEGKRVRVCNRCEQIT